MNRREFTKSLAAAVTAPLVPASALAKAAPAAVAAQDSMYIWADFMARVHNKCSPEMLTRLLKVDAVRGADLCAALMRNGAITAPDVYGISRATNPLYTQFSTVTGHGATTSLPSELSHKNNALEGVGQVEEGASDGGLESDSLDPRKTGEAEPEVLPAPSATEAELSNQDMDFTDR